MSKLQKSNFSQIPFIDYVPAQVKETAGENWRIVFYARKPGTDKMQRFRRRVKKIDGKQARMRYAQRICVEITKKLETGWSPWQEVPTKDDYRPFSEIMDVFIEHCERKAADNLMRPDSLRSYKSYIKNIKGYLQDSGQAEMFTVEVNKRFVVNFLDWVYYEKKRTARTTNNYLSFFGLLASFMLDRGFISQNPTAGVPKKKEGKKKREIIPVDVRKEIFEHLGKTNENYQSLCMTVFYCFVRRTEISKLKVKHVNLVENTIFVPGESAKNGKDGVVTIPKKLKKLLARHIEGAKADYFLFGHKDFSPAEKPVKPKKISDTWAKMRSVLKFKETYQFYSLKDTGITQLFLLGVPIIKIRDQARHHDIKITETYTPRNYKCDDTIRDLDFDF